MAYTLRDVINKAAAYLAGAGIEASRLEAELIVGASTALDRMQLYVQFERPVSETELETMRALLRARVKERVPVAYLTGHKQFLGLALAVPGDVFIPRPETEELVEAVVARLTGNGIKPDQPLSVLDLCTGTGAIGIALAKKFRRATVLAVDISPPAVSAAGINVDGLHLGERVSIRQGDLWEAVPPDLDFDLIVSNPPYIPTAAMTQLPLEIKNHEPCLALDGGEDGLDFYRRIFAVLPQRLRAGGVVGLEHGDDQGEALASMAQRADLIHVEQLSDLAGRPRIVTAQKKASTPISIQP